MNKRIKQLAEQAASTIDTTRGNTYVSHPEFNKKFAELIVKECVSIVAKRKNQAIDDDWNIDEAMSMAEMDLEEHFGVE